MPERCFLRCDFFEQHFFCQGVNRPTGGGIEESPTQKVIFIIYALLKPSKPSGDVSTSLDKTGIVGFIEQWAQAPIAPLFKLCIVIPSESVNWRRNRGISYTERLFLHLNHILVVLSYF